MKTRMGGIDRGVKLAAEREARRKLDPIDDYPRRVGQFKYDAVDALSEGRGRGVFSTAPLQRERSCTVELRTLLEDQVGELQPVKVGARGVVFLMAHGGDDKQEAGADVELLRRVDRLYSGTITPAFCMKVVPILRSVRLDYHNDNNACAGDAGQGIDQVGDERLFRGLERIGADLEGIVSRAGPIFCVGSHPTVQPGGVKISIAVKFSSRKLLGEDLKQRCITALGRGFAERSVSGQSKRVVGVSLSSPDVVIVVEGLDVMGRKFLLVGLAPARWLAPGKLQLRALNEAARKRATDGGTGSDTTCPSKRRKL
ncbi:MAG: hypothetical protein ABGY24_05230 [bacterium]